MEKVCNVVIYIAHSVVNYSNVSSSGLISLVREERADFSSIDYS